MGVLGFTSQMLILIGQAGMTNYISVENLKESAHFSTAGFVAIRIYALTRGRMMLSVAIFVIGVASVPNNIAAVS